MRQRTHVLALSAPVECLRCSFLCGEDTEPPAIANVTAWESCMIQPTQTRFGKPYITWLNGWSQLRLPHSLFETTKPLRPFTASITQPTITNGNSLLRLFYICSTRWHFFPVPGEQRRTMVKCVGTYLFISLLCENMRPLTSAPLRFGPACQRCLSLTSTESWDGGTCGLFFWCTCIINDLRNGINYFGLFFGLSFSHINKVKGVLFT